MRPLALFLCCTLLIPLTFYAQDDTCDGFSPRLFVDGRGRVVPGDANNVRAEASADAELIGQLPGETVFTVLDGFICADNLTWWEVSTLDGTLTGWTVEGIGDEYWLEPGGWLGYSAEQVGLDYTTIANQVTVATLPPTLDSDLFYEGAPDLLQVLFEDTIIAEYITPQILVVPVDFFTEENNNIDLESSLTRFQDSLFSDTPTPDDRVLLPPINAGQVHDSHVEYIETDTLRGYRYIAMYAQYPAPVRGYEMFYGFAGFTQDGTHSVSMVLPVTSTPQDIFFTTLSETENISNDAGVLPEYREMLSDHAAALGNDDFYPSLDVLDAVVRSFQLVDGATLPEPFDTRPFERVILPAMPGTTLFEEEDLTAYVPLYYEAMSATSEYPYLTVQGVPEANIQRDMLIYEGWQTFMEELAAETPPEEMSGNPMGFMLESTPIGAVEFIETDHLRGVRFVMAGGPPDNVRAPLTYRFWGVTANNTALMVSSHIPLENPPEAAPPADYLAMVDADVLEAALIERDGLVTGLRFAVR